MAHHPTGETVEILGLNPATNGRSCPDHDNCGSVVKPDVVVRLRKVQVIIQGKEESAIAAYWVTDGIDSCHVGFLPKHCVRHWTDRIPSTTPGAEPPRDAKDSGSARSHSTHLETSSSNRP